MKWRFKKLKLPPEITASANGAAEEINRQFKHIWHLIDVLFRWRSVSASAWQASHDNERGGVSLPDPCSENQAPHWPAKTHQLSLTQQKWERWQRAFKCKCAAELDQQRCCSASANKHRSDPAHKRLKAPSLLNWVRTEGGARFQWKGIYPSCRLACSCVAPWQETLDELKETRHP